MSKILTASEIIKLKKIYKTLEINHGRLQLKIKDKSAMTDDFLGMKPLHCNMLGLGFGT